MQNKNGVKQRFLDCFLKILDKKRKKWRELLPDQYAPGDFFLNRTAHSEFHQTQSAQGAVVIVIV